MLKSGKPQKEVAQVFGVSEGAISKAKKELNINVVKSVSLEAAHKVVEDNLDTVVQLQKINRDANEILDLLMRWQRGDDAALQILESQEKLVNVGTKKQPNWVKDFKIKDPRELALKAMAEIRNQLNLQLDIFRTLYDTKAVAEFQREVLTAIGEADVNVREKIIHRLNEKRTIRSAIKFD